MSVIDTIGRVIRRPADWLARKLAISPQAARYLLITAALIYIILPNDLIPDWLGILGRLDDLLILTYIIYRYRKVMETINGAAGAFGSGPAGKQAQGESQKQQSGQQAAGAPADPYQVLGVRRGAPKDEIKEAYRKLAAQYHPDKVSHLGPELRELAHQKMIEIQKAYEKIG